MDMNPNCDLICFNIVALFNVWFMYIGYLGFN